MHSVRESARLTQCKNKVRQVAIAVLNFESTHGSIPAGTTSRNAQPYAYQSWLQQLLPFLEQNPIYLQAIDDYEQSPNPASGHVGMQTLIHVFQCPSEPEAERLHWTHDDRLVATTSYLGVSGTDWETKDGVFYVDSKIRMSDIHDGTSNTLMICLLYTSPSPRDRQKSRMPSSA